MDIDILSGWMEYQVVRSKLNLSEAKNLPAAFYKILIKNIR